MDDNNEALASQKEAKKAIARKRGLIAILALDAIVAIMIAVSVVSLFTGSGDSVSSEPETSQQA